MSQSPRKPVALALGAALAGLALSPQAFAMTDLAAGYMLEAAQDQKAAEGKCGEGKCGGKRGHTIANMDTDKDGAVSRAEFAAMHDGDASRFAQYDTDNNGSISQAELDAAHAAKKAGEGKCGEGKCGEGKCGGAKASTDKPAAKAGEGKCGEGKCGEGKCGGSA